MDTKRVPHQLNAYLRCRASNALRRKGCIVRSLRAFPRPSVPWTPALGWWLVPIPRPGNTPRKVHLSQLDRPRYKDRGDTMIAVRRGVGRDNPTMKTRPPAADLLADQPAREANQDRRKGRHPWPLRHLPDGRGRGATTDVSGNPVADRPVAGTARASMRSARIRCDQSWVTSLVVGAAAPRTKAWISVLPKPSMTFRRARRGVPCRLRLPLRPASCSPRCGRLGPRSARSWCGTGSLSHPIARHPQQGCYRRSLRQIDHRIQ
jgi:hypothetical protein